MKNNFEIVKIISITLILISFGAVLFLGDFIILYLLKQKKIKAHNWVAPRLSNTRIYKKHNLKNINKKNIGIFLDEGSLVTNSQRRGAHHDSEEHYFVKKHENKENIIWVFGDSWGNGIKSNEAKNKTLENTLDKKFSKLRIISSASWSPLLMNIAFRHYIMAYSEIPNQVVLFIDQTDIGNDYCKYRPLVERDKQGKLLSVYNNIYYSQSEFRWRLNQSLRQYKSGLSYLLAYIVAKIDARLNIEIPGINICRYQDNLAWQIGEKNSPNGTPIIYYEKYFKKNISNFINEIRNINSKADILLVTHDWDQHSLKPIIKAKTFENNLSSLVIGISEKNNVEKLHISTNDYLKEGIDSKNIYIPNDLTSHLQDYSLLSKKIGLKLINMLDR